MKQAFALAVLGLVGLSLVAWKLQPAPARAGTQPIVWTSDDNPLRKDQYNLFNRQSRQYDLRLDPGNNVLEKVIVQSLAGVGPDVFDCYDGFQLSAYVKSGVAMDLTDVLKEAGIDVEKDTFQGAHAPCIYEGRVYGMPTNVAADGVWFHKDIFEQEHIPFPPKANWKWPELIALAQRLTQRDHHGKVTRFGFLFEWYNWAHFVRGFGGHVYSEDGTRCVLDSPETVAAIQLMQDLIYKYKVAPSPSEEAAMATQGGWGSGMTSYFGARRGAMSLGGRWWLATLRSYKGLKLGVAESPYQTIRAFRGYGRGALVNNNSKNKAGALEFVKFLANRDYNELVNDQADGISAFKQYAQGERFLHNPAYPGEDSNDVWLEAAKHALPDETSPFIDGGVATRLIQLQLDLVRAGEKTAKQAMEDARRAVNEEIAKTLQEDPSLRKRYEALTRPHERK